MKLLDVVNQLRVILPRQTDRFSTSLGVASISATGGVATVATTSAHGLSTGGSVTLSGVQSQTPLDAGAQDGLQFTFGTSIDHDLTLNWPAHEDVELAGFTDSAWNGSFKVLAVANRQTFTVQSTNVLPTLNGGEKLLEDRVDGVNGRYSVKVVDATSFTVDGDFLDGDYVGGVVSAKVRIAGTVDIERAIEQYTEQGIEDFWAFVEMRDAEISKSRNADSDAVASVATGNSIRQRLIDGFAVYVVVNVSEQIAAESAVDVCRHGLLLPMLKSVFGATFDTGLTGSDDFKTVFLGHGVSQYQQHTFVYQYDFEVAMDLTGDDAVEPTDTRAFRDIDYTHEIDGDDTDDLTVKINLDEEPLQ